MSWTAAAASKKGEAVLLPAGWGDATIRAEVCHDAGGSAREARAYDHLGNKLTWFPNADLTGERIACDLEDRRRDVLFMAALFGLAPAEFLPRWVASEVLAKLTNVPIHLWIRSGGLFWCEPGTVAQIQVSAGTAHLIVVAESARMMAFGFVR